jgi:mRNA interferase MazF
MTFPRRGEIHLVQFDPSRGHEIRKTRPAVIIQNDVGNRHSAVTIVAAITSAISAHPVTVAIAPTKANGLSTPSSIHLGQIRTVDRERLVERLGAVDSTTMRRLDNALKISLGLVEV